jgi:hypothetical protein
MTLMGKPANATPTWRIYLIRKRGERGAFLGMVEAPDEKAAIAEAIKRFEIMDSERQKRLVAQCLG